MWGGVRGGGVGGGDVLGGDFVLREPIITV